MSETAKIPVVDIELPNQHHSPIPKRTPLETKGVRRVSIELEDGATLDFDFDEELIGGFYRCNELVRNGYKVIQHEVYITDGNSR